MSDSPSKRRLNKYVEKQQKPPTRLIALAWVAVFVGGLFVGLGAMKLRHYDLATSSHSGYLRYQLYEFAQVFLSVSFLPAFAAMVMGIFACRAPKSGAGGLLAALAAMGLMAVAGFLLYNY